MPIVEPPVAGYPLSQGDILQGVKLFVTQANGSSAAATDYALCMVISRPCVVAHKGQVVVAGVKAYTEGVPGTIDNLEKVLDFMTGVRDGVASPDLFYLGQLPGQTGRYCSRLDSIHTIEIPAKPHDRREYIDRYRIAALNQKIDGALLAAVEAYTRCIGSHGVQRAAPAVGRQGESRPVVEMGTC